VIDLVGLIGCVLHGEHLLHQFLKVRKESLRFFDDCVQEQFDIFGVVAVFVDGEIGPQPADYTVLGFFKLVHLLNQILHVRANENFLFLRVLREVVT